MSAELIIGFITTVLGSNILSIIVTHRVNKGKYQSDVSASEIGNLKEAISVYKMITEDNKQTIRELIQKTKSLDTRLAKIEGILTKALFDTCTIKECPNRIRYENLSVNDILTEDGDQGKEIDKD